MLGQKFFFIGCCRPLRIPSCTSYFGKPVVPIYGFCVWLSSFQPTLNPTKTQFIWLDSRRRLLTNVDRCLVAETFPRLVFCDTVRDLGIILDQELNFSVHINQLTCSCYYQLRQLHTVSRSLFH